MNDSPDYYLKTDFAFHPELMDIGKVNHEYLIYQGNIPLTTPMGNQFSHSSERFVRTLLTDIQLRQTVGDFGLSYSKLFAYKVDIIDSGVDPIFEKIRAFAMDDPFIKLKIFENQSLKTFSPDDKLFNFAFITLSGLISDINGYISTLMSEISIEESETHPLVDLIVARYFGLDPWKKSVLHMLMHLHGSGLILPIGLITGLINPADYSKGLIALKIKTPSEFSATLYQVADACNFLASLTEHDTQVVKIQQIIDGGEGDSTEFKSTLRWDIRAGKTNQAIERACLKSISAFLNTRGGYLLIGVRDDGSIEGIETDKFSNEDKFLLHLWTLIRTCLGRDFSPYIRTIMEKADDKTVCIVHCQPASRPVFLRQPGFAEEMFIRVGPSSNALDISEALQYIRTRFLVEP